MFDSSPSHPHRGLALVEANRLPRCTVSAVLVRLTSVHVALGALRLARSAAHLDQVSLAHRIKALCH
eukprot:scaffold104758_cov32-Tisochrysis_lutea.AAC.2